MRHILLNQTLTVILFVIFLGYTQFSRADEGGAVMDPTGTVRNFTGFAKITCVNDGNGNTDYLEANIIDKSDPVNGLLVNLQLIKDGRAVSISDTVSGDASASPYIRLQGGDGVYSLLVNKTDAGARQFVINYHCKTATGSHTATSIAVEQFE